MTSTPRKSKSLDTAQRIAAIVEGIAGCPTRATLKPNVDIKRINDREISVWPESRAVGFKSRELNQVDMQIGICVLERMPPTEDEDILGDDLLHLVETIGEQFIGAQIETDDDDLESTLHCLGYTHEPLYDRDFLETARIFGAGIFLSLQRHEVRVT